MSLGVLPGVLRTRPSTLLEEPLRDGRIGVCHVASGDLWAGAEAQLAALLGALVRRPDLILRVILLNEGRLAGEVRSLGIELKVIPESQKSFLQVLGEATRYLRGHGIHVLHSHRYKENLLSALLAWRCHVPLVVRSQHGLPETFAGFKGLKQHFQTRLDRLVARYATDRIISVSAELRHHLMRDLDPCKVVVIQNGLDTSQVCSDLSTAQAKRRLGIPEECWVVGAASRLEPIKRLDIFLTAAREIAAAIPNSRFVIAGEGREEARLRALAGSSGLGGRVLMLGHRNDIYDVLRAFDIFVLSSDHEGLPMVLLEAMFLGIPVVARAAGGIADVVENEVSGVLVPSEDSGVLAEACVKLAGDKARRSRLARAGAGVVGVKFSAERTATEVAELYGLLCGAQVKGSGSAD